MSVFKDTFSLALNIYPNDFTNIPFPNMVKTGSISGIGINELRDIGANFITSGIQIGDIVFNQSATLYAYVTSVEQDRLYISENIFTLGGEGYEIFQGTNQGCNIYIGDTSGGASMEVVTIGGDLVTFKNLTIGTILPVQVLKVTGNTSVGQLVALW